MPIYAQSVKRSSNVRRNRELKGYKTQSKKLGPVSTTVILTILLGLLAMLYLTQITKTSVYGYQVNSLSDTKQDLQQQQRELAVEAARLHSIERVKAKAARMDLVDEEQVSYVTEGESRVVTSAEETRSNNAGAEQYPYNDSVSLETIELGEEVNNDIQSQ